MGQEPKNANRDAKVAHIDAETKSQIMSMIRSHVSLAGAVALGSPVADTDLYSRGTSPGPVDQYSKGSPSSILQEVSNPADLKAAVGHLTAETGPASGG